MPSLRRVGRAAGRLCVVYVDGEERGYSFEATGTYSALFTDVGGPNGLRTHVPTLPRAFASESATCGVLSQRVSGGDGNPVRDSDVA